MEKSENLIWGIIGVGDVCEKKSAPALYKVPHSKVKTVMRRNEEKVKDYAQRHNIPHYTTSADDILSDPEINAVYIATPPASHAAYAKLCAAAGKITYVEKPMALSFKECEEMNKVFKEADLTLYVAYYRRALPNFLKVKSILEEGTIGEVRMVQVQLYQKPKQVDFESGADNWRVQPEVAGGGYFHDLASHQFDILDFLLGPIKEARGIAVNQEKLYTAEDAVTAHWIFENGALGSGNWCFTTAEMAEKDLITIVGNKGKVSFATFANSEVFLETDSGTSQRFNFEMPEHIQYPLIESMVAEVLGNGKCASTGDSAARTNQVLDWICQK